MDVMYMSPFLKNMAAGDALCIYQSLHTWSMTDDVKAGKQDLTPMAAAAQTAGRCQLCRHIVGLMGIDLFG